MKSITFLANYFKYASVDDDCFKEKEYRRFFPQKYVSLLLTFLIPSSSSFSSSYSCFFLLHLLILLSPPPPPTVYPIFRTPFHTELFSKLTSLQDASSLQWISGNVLGTREQREKFTTSPTQCQLSFKNVRMAANTLFDVRVVLYFVLFII